MKAVVWHGVGDIRLDDVPEPELQSDEDAIVRLTSSAICGTDHHFVRGTMAGMRPGTTTSPTPSPPRRAGAERAPLPRRRSPTPSG